MALPLQPQKKMNWMHAMRLQPRQHAAQPQSAPCSAEAVQTAFQLQKTRSQERLRGDEEEGEVARKNLPWLQLLPGQTHWEKGFPYALRDGESEACWEEAQGASHPMRTTPQHYQPRALLRRSLA
jgi:hypothetical protein